MAIPNVLWPEVAIERRPPHAAYVRSYLRMRKSIGILGIILPLALVLGEPALFDGQPAPRGSLSAYYYSGVRELFVGALCAIGVFLVAYKVADRSRENRLSIYAGVAVILVALFPTGLPGRGVEATPLQQRFGEEWIEGIHFFAAGAFIIALAVISYYFAQPPQDPNVSRSRWAQVHYICAGLIAVAVILAIVRLATGWPDKGVLYAEWLAVWAFGASWLIRGLEIDKQVGGG